MNISDRNLEYLYVIFDYDIADISDRLSDYTKDLNRLLISINSSIYDMNNNMINLASIKQSAKLFIDDYQSHQELCLIYIKYFDNSLKTDKTNIIKYLKRHLLELNYQFAINNEVLTELKKALSDYTANF